MPRLCLLWSSRLELKSARKADGTRPAPGYNVDTSISVQSIGSLDYGANWRWPGGSALEAWDLKAPALRRETQRAGRCMTASKAHRILKTWGRNRSGTFPIPGTLN